LLVPDGAIALPAVVVVPGGPDTADVARATARRLVENGFVALTVDLTGERPDREINADLEAALVFLGELDTVDAERIAAVGFGTGGTYAFLLGCCSRRLAAAVVHAAPLVYAELSALRPAQPLEMALNLSVPVLAFYGGPDDAVPAADVARLRAVCSQFSRDCDIVDAAVLDDGPEFSGPSAPDARAESAWRRTLAFLEERLELRGPA
jgi:carboxymethylenebutenolidase